MLTYDIRKSTFLGNFLLNITYFLTIRNFWMLAIIPRSK